VSGCFDMRVTRFLYVSQWFAAAAAAEDVKLIVHNLVFPVNMKSQYTGLFETIVGVLTTCHTQYTYESNICIFFI